MTVQMPPKCPTCGHQALPDTRVVWAEYVRRVIAGERTQHQTLPGTMVFTTLRVKED